MPFLIPKCDCGEAMTPSIELGEWFCQPCTRADAEMREAAMEDSAESIPARFRSETDARGNWL